MLNLTNPSDLSTQITKNRVAFNDYETTPVQHQKVKFYNKKLSIDPPPLHHLTWLDNLENASRPRHRKSTSVSLEPLRSRSVTTLAEINVARHNRLIIEDEVHHMRRQIIDSSKCHISKKKRKKIKSVREFIKPEIDNDGDFVPSHYTCDE